MLFFSIIISIILLFLHRCPFAITFAIITFVIDSLNRSVSSSKDFFMSHIRRIHIFIKFCEIFPQTLDASSTISVIISYFRISAPTSDRVKNVVKVCSGHSMSFMTFTKKFSLFNKKTAATLYTSPNHSFLQKKFAFPTVTSKVPNLFSIFIPFNHFQGDQSAKPFALYINGIGINTHNYIVV